MTREEQRRPKLIEKIGTIRPLPRPPRKGDVELPVQRPSYDVQIMGDSATQPKTTNDTANTTSTTTSTTQNSADEYTSLNQQIWGEGGSGQQGYDQQLAQEKQYQSQNASSSNAYTTEQLRQQLIAAGIDPALLDEYSQKGGYTQDRDTAIAGGGSGDPVEGFYEDGVWYYYDGTARPVAQGASGADEAHLSDGAYAYIQYCKEMYAKATTAEDKAYWHNEAEKTRARAGYSGGTDGSMYIPLAQLGIEQATDAWRNQYGATEGYTNYPIADESSAVFDNIRKTLQELAASASQEQLSYLQKEQLLSLLEQWKTATQEQINGQIDNATQQAVLGLERALQDAQTQFKGQAESVAIDERQAMDNAALYAQLRGDNGGIGQEQYTSVQNTAAQNRLAVQQAQTKLSTDTARQIEDLRAQGEFEKADKALDITQSYLAQLLSLEQWAAEYNLSVDQFNAQLKQWEQEYKLALQQVELSASQWEQEFGLSKAQFAASLEQWAKEFAFQQGRANASDSQWQQEFNAALEQWAKEFGFNQQQADIANDQWTQKFQAALDQWNQEFALQQEKYRDSQVGSGGSQGGTAGGIGSSAGYDDVVSVAKKKGSADLTDKYLGEMVESGVITLEEADWIFRVLCGYSYSQLTGNKYITEDNNGLGISAEPIHYGSGEYSPVQLG